MKKTLAGIAALALTSSFFSSCYIRIYHGIQRFPELGYGLNYEAQPETEDRPEVYQISCIENEDKSKIKDFERLGGLQPVKGYQYLHRTSFVNSKNQVCSLDVMVQTERASEQGKSKGYAFTFQHAVPEGEIYTLVCGNAESPVPETQLKHKGNYHFSDSAGNTCIFSGFPQP